MEVRDADEEYDVWVLVEKGFRDTALGGSSLWLCCRHLSFKADGNRDLLDPTCLKVSPGHEVTYMLRNRSSLLLRNAHSMHSRMNQCAHITGILFHRLPSMSALCCKQMFAKPKLSPRTQRLERKRSIRWPCPEFPIIPMGTMRSVSSVQSPNPMLDQNQSQKRREADPPCL